MDAGEATSSIFCGAIILGLNITACSLVRFITVFVKDKNIKAFNLILILPGSKE